MLKLGSGCFREIVDCALFLAFLRCFLGKRCWARYAYVGNVSVSGMQENFFVKQIGFCSLEEIGK